MTKQTDSIAQANRKALPKFLLLCLLGGIIGGIVGFCAVFFEIDQLTGAMEAAGIFFSSQVAPWLLVVCVAADLILCLPMYFSAKGQLSRWDGEDEGVSAALDRKLSIAVWINSTLLICALFLAGAAYSAGEYGDVVLFPLAMGAFIVMLVVAIVTQQKLVDLTKRLYPEKNASIYELRFQKKWLDSCDEAEKIIIGKCAYKAYAATSTVCLALWLVFTLSALFLNAGFLPVLAVCVIWAVLQSVFCYWSIKLSQPGAAVL